MKDPAKPIPPVIVTATPVHGAHSRPDRHQPTLGRPEFIEPDAALNRPETTDQNRDRGRRR